MANKRFSLAVFVLSIVCAFLTGTITGYFLFQALLFRSFAALPSRTFVSTEKDTPPELPVRRDALFYHPGNNEIWNDNYEEISAGKGILRGSIHIDKQPAKDLEFALILANGRRTQKARVDADGAYTIRLPQGKYFFNGIVIYNMSEKVNDKFLVNKITKAEGQSMLSGKFNNSAIKEEYARLEAKLGAKEAAEAISKTMATSPPFQDKFPFEISDEAFIFPEFIYCTPVALISPAKNSVSPLQELQFIWRPVEGAAYYKLVITKIEHKGSSTSYRDVLAKSNIKTNKISGEELLKTAHEPVKGCDDETPRELKENALYGFRVVAYNEQNQILTASSDSLTELSAFSVKQ